MRNRVHNVFHLSVISAGVHKYRAADRAGDAPREFKSAESVVERELAKGRERRAGSAVDSCLVDQRDLAELAVKTDNHSPVTLVAYEHVAAVAEDEVVDVGIHALPDYRAEGAERIDLYICIGVAAYLE